MTIALKILRFAGIAWAATVLGKAAGRIEAAITASRMPGYNPDFDWIYLIIGFILAIALIWGTTWLINKQNQG